MAFNKSDSIQLAIQLDWMEINQIAYHATVIFLIAYKWQSDSIHTAYHATVNFLNEFVYHVKNMMPNY
jgi:hypothetical protein